MNQPVVYAVVAMVCYGLSDFTYKQAAAAGICADYFLMAHAWFFCPLVILYAVATHTLVINPAAMWGSLAGTFNFIGLYYFIRSLASGRLDQYQRVDLPHEFYRHCLPRPRPRPARRAVDTR